MDEGMCLLAQAVEESGLPMLLTFEAPGLGGVTGAGVQALASALTANRSRFRRKRRIRCAVGSLSEIIDLIVIDYPGEIHPRHFCGLNEMD